MVVPLIAGVVIWLINIVDAYIAYRRKCTAWSLQRIAEKFNRAVPPALPVALLVALLLAPQIQAADRAADIFAAVRSNDLARAENILRTVSPTSMEIRIGDGITPLHIAAAKNLKEMTSLLLRNGADPDVATAGGFTPLHWAASKNAADAAEVLIKGGANINAATPQGITPLHWAASNNATNVIKLLIVCGADMQTKTTGGFAPLHWALMRDANEAAFIIAYKAASDDIGEASNAMARATSAREAAATKTEVASTNEVAPVAETAAVAPVPEEAVESAREKESVDKTEEEIAALSQSLPITTADEDLIVPLGRGEELVFMRLKGLDIWGGKYEITNGQYRRYKQDHSSKFREKFSLDAKDQPVVYVSWDEAKAYCKWLNKNYGDRLPLKCEFRLPAEKEWIAFARCGDNRKYQWGDEMPPKYGNYSDLAAKQKLSNWRGINNFNDGFVVSCPVEESGANEWGLCGVGGNVWEWCEDWHDTGKKYKVRHGGSWDYDAEEDLTVEARGFDRPDARDDTIGFRVVVALKDR
jgi:formylglycine-generating enzyme required for sulfatase activity